MRRVVPGWLLLMFVAGWAGRSFAAPIPGAMVSGTVRDAHGTPQMGALIELFRGDLSPIGTAFSDTHGRYLIAVVSPGRYQMRASAAFFMPLLRNNVRLQPGVQSVVNLTLSAMFESDNWLPAQRRRADEPVDDWKWTLRSTANRPLLRLVDPEDGQSVSSSAEQTHRVLSQGRVIVSNGDGAFGDGGMHQALVLDRSMEDGDGAIFRADVGDTQNPYSTGPSVAVITGYERRSSMVFPIGGSTRLVGSFQSHPELTNGVAGNGFQVLHVASTRQMALGDSLMVDVGTLLQAERMQQLRMEAAPFVRVTARPTGDIIVEYRYASNRELQSSDDLDKLKPTLTSVADNNGRPLKDRGRHQELSVSRKLGSRVLSASAFSDRYAYGAIGGSGVMDATTLQQLGVIADPSTATFEVAAQGYSGRGLSLGVMQPLTPALSVWVEYDLGTALRSNGFLDLTNLAGSVAPHLASAASAALRGKILRTGTALRAEYRWQPLQTLTQVNVYNATPEEAYLSFYVRQRILRGRLFPQGLDAVVEANNLLQQGYQPVIGPDGETLVLAQVPRAIQGGLAFNF